MFQAVLDSLVAHQPWSVDFRNNQHDHSFSPQPASNRGGLNGKATCYSRWSGRRAYARHALVHAKTSGQLWLMRLGMAGCFGLGADARDLSARRFKRRDFLDDYSLYVAVRFEGELG